MTPTQQEKDKAAAADAESRKAAKAADDADPKSDAASSDTEPRDPSQAIPPDVMANYLNPIPAGATAVRQQAEKDYPSQADAPQK